MKPLRIIGLLTVISLVFLRGFGGTALAAPRTSGILTQTMCLSDYRNNPSGRVIMAFPQTLSLCSLNNLFTDQSVTVAPTPTTQTTVCDPSVPPPDFLVIAEGSSSACAGGYTQVILPLTETTMLPSITVCDSSPIPNNWVIIAESVSTAAARTCRQSAVAHGFDPSRPIQPTIESPPLTFIPLKVCGNTFLPSDFTFVSNTSSAACVLDQGNSSLIVRTSTH